MSTGKKYERELVQALRDVTVTAERVPRSVADALPSKIDDVICVPEGMPVADSDHRPITDYLQELDDPRAFAEYVGSVVKVECKYTSSGAHGVQTLLDAHLRGPGLGWPNPVYWQGADVYSGGPAAFATALEYGDGSAEAYEVGGSPPKGASGLLEDADAAAIRASREPWVMIWKPMEAK